MGGKRPSKRDPALLTAVERHMVLCVPTDESLGLLREEGFTCSLRTLERYRKAVRDRWQQEEVELRPERRAELRAMVRSGYRGAVEAGQYFAAAKFAALLAKMDGLEAPVRVELDAVVSVAALSPVQRQREIAGLLARREIAALASSETDE